MSLDMSVFDVVRTRSIKRIRSNEIVTSEWTFKAPKGHTFAFLLLGMVKDGEEFNPEQALNDGGWTFTGQSPAKRRSPKKVAAKKSRVSGLPPEEGTSVSASLDDPNG